MKASTRLRPQPQQSAPATPAPAAKRAAKSAVRPAAKPLAKPPAKPPARPPARPLATSTARPTLQSIIKLAAKPRTTSTAKPTAKATAKAGSKPATKAGVKSVAKPAAGSKRAAKKGAKPAAKRRREPAPGAGATPPQSGWGVYILRCADGTLYTGCTNDQARRLRSHGRGQVKYTRGRLPVALAYWEGSADKSAALRREAALKRLSRPTKLALCG